MGWVKGLKGQNFQRTMSRILKLWKTNSKSIFWILISKRNFKSLKNQLRIKLKLKKKRLIQRKKFKRKRKRMIKVVLMILHQVMMSLHLMMVMNHLDLLVVKRVENQMIQWQSKVQKMKSVHRVVRKKLKRIEHWHLRKNVSVGSCCLMSFLRMIEDMFLWK